MFMVILSFLLVTSCFVLSMFSLLRAPWTSFESNDSRFEQSLFSSLQSPDEYDRADYTCLEALTCSGQDNDICSISQKLILARSVFLPFEVLSLATQVFILERLILKLFNKPFGSPNYFLFLIWAFPLFKAIGAVIFLILSDVSFDSSYSRGEVKAEYGIYINFASIFASILASLLMIFFKVHKTGKLWRVQAKVSTGKFFNPMLMYLISQTLFILSNVYPTASYNEFNVVNINVEYVQSMDGYKDYMPIPCIAGQECKISEYTCKVFNSLSTTSNIVSNIRSVSYVFALLWGESFLHLLIKIRLGTNFLNFAYPILFVTFCIIGLVYYVIKANLGYGAKCNIEDFTDGWALCAELGTTFYIITVIFGFLTVITYVLIYAIYSTRAGFGREQKIMDDSPDDDLKKDHLDKTQMDNNAVKTAPNIIRQTTNMTVTTVQTLSNKECFYCHKSIPTGEKYMTEGQSIFHMKCYLVNDKKVK